MKRQGFSEFIKFEEVGRYTKLHGRGRGELVLACTTAFITINVAEGGSWDHRSCRSTSNWKFQTLFRSSLSLSFLLRPRPPQSACFSSSDPVRYTVNKAFEEAFRQLCLWLVQYDKKKKGDTSTLATEFGAKTCAQVILDESTQTAMKPERNIKVDHQVWIYQERPWSVSPIWGIRSGEERLSDTQATTHWSGHHRPRVQKRPRRESGVRTVPHRT